MEFKQVSDHGFAILAGTAVVVCTVTWLATYLLSSKSKSSLSSRELSSSELFYHNTYVQANAIVTFIFVVESKTKVKEMNILQALETLSMHHPILRAKIVENVISSRKRYYFGEFESLQLTCRSYDLDAATDTNWEHMFTKELSTDFDTTNGPLWRFARLKENYLPEKHCFVNCFAWSFHHSLIDGFSTIQLIDAWLQLVGNKLPEDDPVFQYRPFTSILPACETFLADMLKKSWIETLAFNFRTRLKLVWNSFRKEDSTLLGFFDKYPIEENATAVKETRACFLTFSKEDTRKLLTACRDRGLTITAAVFSAASIAMAELLYGNERKQECCITSSCVVNTRRHSQHISIGDQIGLFVGILPLSCKVPVFREDHLVDVFWEVGKQLSYNLSKGLSDNRHLVGFNDLDILSDQSLTCSYFDSNVSPAFQERYYGSYFSISNMGRFDQSKMDDLSLSKLFFAYGEHIRGPLFVNNFVSVNGCLCWTPVYYPNVVSKRLAKEYRCKILSILQTVINTE